MSLQIDNVTRVIRNVEVVPLHLQRLVARKKVNTALMDAYAGVVQQRAEQASHDIDFCIFPSCSKGFIGVKEGSRQLALLKDHLATAAPFGSTEAFAKTRRWGIPLCDNDHWVFVWLDWDTHTIGLFDSERKPTSESWAKPALRCIMNHFVNLFGLRRIAWKDTWQIQRHGPEREQLQNDDTSCGYYVMLAMECWSRGDSFVGVTRRDVKAMPRRALNSLLDLPEGKARRVSSRSAAIKPENPPRVLATSQPNTSPQEPRAPVIDKASQAAPVPSRARLAVSHSRSWRRTQLKTDPWVAGFNTKSVKCAGCAKTVTLQRHDLFHLHNWAAHKLQCAYVLGTVSEPSAKALPSTPLSPGAGCRPATGGCLTPLPIPTPEPVASGCSPRIRRPGEAVIPAITDAPLLAMLDDAAAQDRDVPPAAVTERPTAQEVHKLRRDRDCAQSQLEDADGSCAGLRSLLACVSHDLERSQARRQRYEERFAADIAPYGPAAPASMRESMHRTLDGINQRIRRFAMEALDVSLKLAIAESDATRAAKTVQSLSEALRIFEEEGVRKAEQYRYLRGPEHAS